MRKMNKKMFVIMMLFVIFMLSMTACGKKSTAVNDNVDSKNQTALTADLADTNSAVENVEGKDNIISATENVAVAAKNNTAVKPEIETESKTDTSKPKNNVETGTEKKPETTKKPDTTTKTETTTKSETTTKPETTKKPETKPEPPASSESSGCTHEFSNQVLSEIHPENCTARARSVEICNKCGYISKTYDDTGVVENHAYGTPIVTYPTCTTPGE